MVLDKGLYDKIESIHNKLFEVNKIENFSHIQHV